MKKVFKRGISVILAVLMITSTFSVVVSATGPYTIILKAGTRSINGEKMETSFVSKIQELEGDTYTDENGVVYTIDKENKIVSFQTDDSGTFVFPEFFFEIVGYDSQHAWSRSGTSNSGNYGVGKSLTIKRNTTYYGSYNQTMYTVSFEPGSSEGVQGSATTFPSKAYGTSITYHPSVFTRRGYIQVGWASVDGATEAEYSLSSVSVVITDNMVLYPVWEKAIYDVDVDTTSVDFNKICYTYTLGSDFSKKITITNKGNITITYILPVSDAYNIEVTDGSLTLDPEETLVISISPKDNLAMGSYNEDLIMPCDFEDVSLQLTALLEITDHNYSSEWTIDLEPTCITAGSKTHKCLYCDARTDITEIKATGVCVYTYTKNFASNTKTGVCSSCGNTVTLDMVSEDCLTFTLSDDGNSYSVIDCYDSVQYTDIVIPAMYNGLPVTSIGEAAFDECTNLIAVTVPESITSIGSGAFYACTSLNSITIPDSVTSIGDYIFQDCTNLTSIKVSDSITSIGDGAFGGCTSLNSITIPDSVTRIGDSAFCECTSLTALKIPDSVTSIGNGVFSYCTNLYFLELPKNVTDFGDNIGSFGGNFYQCWNLMSVSIPEGATYMMSGGSDPALQGCHSLAFVVIPDSVSFIIRDAFDESVFLKDIFYSGTSTKWEALSYDGAVSDSVTVHCNDYVHDCPGKPCWVVEKNFTCTENGLVSLKCNVCGEEFETVEIEATCNIKVIDEKTHDAYSGMSFTQPTCKTNGTALSVCNICGKESMRVIPSGSDWHKYSDEWTIDVEPTCIKPGSKSHHCTVCGDQKDVNEIAIIDHTYEWTKDIEANIKTGICSVCGDEVTELLEIDDLLEFTLKSDATGYIVSDCETLVTGEIVIPEMYNDLPVTGISDSAFRYCTRIKSILIPESITVIGENAFSGCDSVVVFCKENSKAYIYADSNSVPYILNTENTIIDLTDERIYTNILGGSLDNIISGSDDVTYAMNTAFAGTGTIVDVLLNGEDHSQYTLIVNGDINGDSVCDVLDCVIVERASSGNAELTGVCAEAGDINGDDVINVNDYSAIVNKALAS